MSDNNVNQVMSLYTKIDPNDCLKIATFIDVFCNDYPEFISEKQENLLRISAKILAGVYTKDVSKSI